MGRGASRVAIGLLIALLSLSIGSGRAAPPGVDSAPATVKAAPEFSREDLDHRKLSLSALRGKVVLLNFWATWCAPCLAEIPQFARWQNAYAGRGLQVVGISMDDDPEPVITAYGKYRLNYPVVMGDAQLGELYGGVYGLPVTFLIDRNGNIRFRHQGAVDLKDLEREFKTLLDPP